MPVTKEQFHFEFNQVEDEQKQKEILKFIFNKEVSVYDPTMKKVRQGKVTEITTSGGFRIRLDSSGLSKFYWMEAVNIEPSF